MSRYVDLDKLSNALCGLRDYQNGNVHFLNGIKTVIEVADGMVEENLEEEKHGEWIEKRSDEVYANGYCTLYKTVCSCCGGEVLESFDNRLLKTRYCYNCGARMDGGKE